MSVNSKLAYIRPLPSASESAQSAIIFGYMSGLVPIFVGSRTRLPAIIRILKPGDELVVARTAYLASDKGSKAERLLDLLERKDEIHARGAIIVDVSLGKRSDAEWPAMKEAAAKLLGRLAQGRKGAANGAKGKPALRYTKAELKTMRAVGDDPKYKNWEQRRAAMVTVGITPPSRAWFYANVAHEKSSTARTVVSRKP